MGVSERKTMIRRDYAARGLDQRQAGAAAGNSKNAFYALGFKLLDDLACES